MHFSGIMRTQIAETSILERIERIQRRGRAQCAEVHDDRGVVALVEDLRT